MTVEARLKKLEPTFKAAGRRFAPDPIRADDLSQEARIAVWKELVKAERDGRTVNDSYLKQRVKWTMLSGSKAGRELAAEEDFLADSLPPVQAQDASVAYHHNEIAEAIAALTPRQREYIRLRFWEGLNRDELIERGYSRNLWYAPSGARAKLQESLAHLNN